MSTYRKVILEAQDNSHWRVVKISEYFMHQKLNEFLLWQNPTLGKPTCAEEFPPLPSTLTSETQKVITDWVCWVATCLNLEQFRAGIELMREKVDESASTSELGDILALAELIHSSGVDVRFFVLLDH